METTRLNIRLNGINRVYKITSISPVKSISAIILSIVPGLGQVYYANLTRGIIACLTFIAISWFCAVIFLYIESREISFFVLCLPFMCVFLVSIDAVMCANQHVNIPNNNKLRITQIIVFLTLFSAINVLADNLIGKYVVRAYYVTSNSMSPTIVKHDIILIDKLSNPKKSDIVLIQFDDSDIETSISSLIVDQVLRRVISTENDNIEMYGKYVFVNRIKIDEPYVNYGSSESLNKYIYSKYKWGPAFVPMSSYFVLSDSREYGFDSRDFSFISKNRIKGVAKKVLWSWNLDEGVFLWNRTASVIK